jgi:hypothetical protein
MPHIFINALYNNHQSLSLQPEVHCVGFLIPVPSQETTASLKDFTSHLQEEISQSLGNMYDKCPTIVSYSTPHYETTIITLDLFSSKLTPKEIKEHLYEIIEENVGFPPIPLTWNEGQIIWKCSQSHSQTLYQSIVEKYQSECHAILSVLDKEEITKRLQSIILEKPSHIKLSKM